MRTIAVQPPFDLARTVAPVWWARGRWPNVDWQGGVFSWVGWEQNRIVWRAVTQRDQQTLEVSGSGDHALDDDWASRVLGVAAVMPKFSHATLKDFAIEHSGMKPWSAGSHFEGIVSSVVGQSISVAAAATTERRLYGLFNKATDVGGRDFWPPPTPLQLATAEPAHVRASGVTATRASALVAVGNGFACGQFLDAVDPGFDPLLEGVKLRAISGIGPWTVRSALLWGLAEPDAHPTGDVALLRAVRRSLPDVETLKQLDRVAEEWRPHRGWAARLFWLDLLGFDG